MSELKPAENKVNESNNTKLYLQVFGMLVGVIIGLIIAKAAPPEGLTQQSMIGLGIFICTIIWWIINLIPDYVVILLMCSCWVLFGAVDFGTAFAGFSNKNVWLLIGAFGLAVGVSQSGLLTRLSLFLMSLFPINFKGQSLGLMITGTVLQPLIPSGSAKIAVVAPLTAEISKNMGYAQKSKGALGLWSSMFISLGTMHPLFLSGSFLCYAMVGLLPAETQGDITWMTWFINALPWGIAIFVLGYLSILFMYKPEVDNVTASEMVKEQRAALGPIKRQEWISIAVLAVALLLWMTERIHGIPAGVVAVIAMCILISFKLIDRTSFKAKIAWDALVFIGCIYGLGGVFKVIGLTDYIGGMVGPYIIPMISGNIVLFLIGLAVLIYLARFLMASQLAMFSIITVLLAPLAIEAGIHPWIIGFASFVSVNVWIFMYQNAQYLVALFGADGGEMVDHKQNIKLCLVYMVISIIGLIISIPFWKLTGMIG